MQSNGVERPSSTVAQLDANDLNSNIHSALKQVQSNSFLKVKLGYQNELILNEYDKTIQ